jgi:pantoate--beta-alanine ligase
MRAMSDTARGDDKRITLVPTMGFLHAGHASLIRRARRDGDVVVVSLFVNPTQFGPKEDFSSYPRDLERDRELISACGGDVLFAPTVEEMYPDGVAAYVDVDGLTESMCGASRPGHFKGVATIVTKLFTSVRPHAAVFGQKDAQQALVIKRLTRDLNLGVEILISPTVREADGLARSSRNAYLSDDERRRAAVLFYALQEGRQLILEGERDRDCVLARMRKLIEERSGAEIDYVESVDPETLVSDPYLERNTLLAVAVKFGRARLIDNVVVDGGRVCAESP